MREKHGLKLGIVDSVRTRGKKARTEIGDCRFGSYKGRDMYESKIQDWPFRPLIKVIDTSKVNKQYHCKEEKTALLIVPPQIWYITQ